MREIKFRAWGVRTKIMYSLDPKNEKGTLSDLIENINWKVMQYTGLKDKNGKEIWEGDVVRQQYWPPEGRCEISLYDVRFDHGCFSNSGAESEDIEVLGNIYENPELLK